MPDPLTPEDVVTILEKLAAPAANATPSRRSLVTVERGFIQRVADAVRQLQEENAALRKTGDYTAPPKRYTPVEALELSPRITNALINADVGSVEELVQYKRVALLTIRGITDKAIVEINEALARIGCTPVV